MILRRNRPSTPPTPPPPPPPQHRHTSHLHTRADELSTYIISSLLFLIKDLIFQIRDAFERRNRMNQWLLGRNWTNYPLSLRLITTRTMLTVWTHSVNRLTWKFLQICVKIFDLVIGKVEKWIIHLSGHHLLNRPGLSSSQFFFNF